MKKLLLLLLLSTLALGQRNHAPPDKHPAPAPPDMAVQFDNLGVFGGTHNFTWNNSTRALRLNGSLTVTQGNTPPNWFSVSSPDPLTTRNTVSIIGNGPVPGTNSSGLEIHNYYPSGLFVFTHNDNPNFQAPIFMFHSGGTQESPTIIPQGNLGTVYFGGYNGNTLGDGLNGYAQAASINGTTQGPWSSTSTPSGIYFQTTPVGSTTPGTVAVLDNSGFFALGSGEDTTNSYILQTKGFAVALSAPRSPGADSDLHDSNITFWVDEVNNVLNFRVKYSNGTLKTGVLPLN